MTPPLIHADKLPRSFMMDSILPSQTKHLFRALFFNGNQIQPGVSERYHLKCRKRAKEDSLSEIKPITFVIADST
jgi:hypothetical protein